MNLSFVDLIKNRLFKELKKEHPDDDARTKWKNIRNTIASRDGVDLENFIRHWWISKYNFVSADKLYNAFKKKWLAGDISPEKFISELSNDASLYIKLTHPLQSDFRQQEETSIYNSLTALEIFGVTQTRPFLLSLFEAKYSNRIKFDYLSSTLLFLEKFHFIFNAVCSMRPSGIDQSYSLAIRKLNSAKNKIESKRAIEQLKDSLKNRIPDENNFIENFLDLKFRNGYTKQKKLIQYIFVKIEKHKQGSNEWTPESIALEHILPQSTGEPALISSIGNILPLGKELNNKADSKSIEDKISIYKDSRFALTKDFALSYDGVWDADRIKIRAEALAKLSFSEVWNL